MKLKLDSETKRKLKIVKRANVAQRKLNSGKPLNDGLRQRLKRQVAIGLNLCSTPSELRLRERIAALGFKQNEVVFGFIPDFIHEYLKIAVEVDGGVHNRPDVKVRDDHKNEAFERHGWIVLRFTNKQTLNELDAITKTIKDTMQKRMRGTL